MIGMVGMNMRVENHLLLAPGWMCGMKEKGVSALGQCLISNTICSGTEYSSSRLWGLGVEMSLFFSMLIQGLGVKFTWRDR